MQAIYRGESPKFPKLQFLRTTTINGKSLNRWDVMLSDGQHICVAMLAKKVKWKLTSGQLDEKAIIRLDNYTLTRNRKYFEVQDLCILRKGKDIGVSIGKPIFIYHRLSPHARPSGVSGLSNAAGPSRASVPSGASGPSRAAQPSGAAGPSRAAEPSNAAGPTGDTGPSRASVPSGAAGSSRASVPSGAAGPSRASVPSGAAGPSRAAQPSRIAGPSAAAGTSNAAGPSGAMGPSRASVPSGAAGPSRAAEPSGIAGPSNAPGPSTDTASSSILETFGDAALSQELTSSGSALSDEGDQCPEGLQCPLCLDAFKNPTLLACGHTFCKACLQEYDKQHTGRDYMECPVCRKRTKLAHDRVSGFPSNFSVKVLKDELCKKEEGSSADFCPLHSQLFRDILCEDCAEFICLTCFIDKHQGHKIKKKEQLNAQLKKKRDSLLRKSKEKKARIDKSITSAEQHKLDTYAHFESLKKKVKVSLAKKARILRENGKRLQHRLYDMQVYHDEMLQTCIADQRQSVDTINKCLGVLASNTSRCSNMDSLNAHHLQLSDVKNSLTAITDEVSMADVKQTAEMTQFFPADDNVLEVGHIQLGENGPPSKDEEVKTVAEGSINEEDLQATTKVLGTPARVRSTLSLVRKIDLPHMMSGMAALWQNAVVIGYGSHSQGSDCFFVSGGKRPYMRTIGAVHDLAILTDRSTVVSQDGKIFHQLDPQDTNRKIGIQYACKRDNGFFTLCSDQKDNIYAINGHPEIYVFKSRNPDPVRVIPGKTNAMHICVLKTGVMITSTCAVKPSTVTMYDEEGHVGDSITGSDEGEYLYAVVDSLDRVLVARVECNSDMLSLTRYIIQDSKLIVQTWFKLLKIPHLNSLHQGNWCYMVSLTPNMLAFAHATHLYFIKLAA
eukprot:XP_011676393.1 PREDICTED: uncharacterized protein LOC100888142 isoform X2 [Strongylocentrotus purpuratus]